ncbi:MAG: HD domain-containing protein [Clostridia bacterium]|nr:HD domain-containing protein [Clostridia bacterium]
MKDVLKEMAANEGNPKWENIIKRENQLYTRGNDIRSDFERDYTRIIHSLDFRRMKHKTQVFFSPVNDHICTRMEHVILVESISNTIANYLGLNTELTKAIAMAHDIGHSPFGHQGEKILSKISKRDIDKTFWHEQKGLEIVDKMILLEDDKQNLQNLNITYGVRDGIVSHCGEIDENSLRPREEYIDLYDYNYPNEYKPYTWEGCVVKIADKIAYLGRDIQDAITLGILDEHLEELHELMNIGKDEAINNTIIINNLVYDLCENSNIEDGLKFSEEAFEFMNKIKEFNYKFIYLDEKLKLGTYYFELVLNTIYNTLKKYYDEREHIRKRYPEIINEFEDWLKRYWNIERHKFCKNKIVFNIENEKALCEAIIYYISGMTDNYAINTYNKIIRF